MTKEERAKQYLQWLNADRSDEGVKRVVTHINKLVYSNNKQPVPLEYKKSIVDMMEMLAPQYDIILEQSDNSTILELISQVKSSLKNK